MPKVGDVREIYYPTFVKNLLQVLLIPIGTPDHTAADFLMVLSTVVPNSEAANTLFNASQYCRTANTTFDEPWKSMNKNRVVTA